MQTNLTLADDTATAPARRHLCLVATVPYSLNVFMRAHVNVIKTEHDVTLVTNGTPDDLRRLLGPHVSFVPMRIERKVSLWRDIVALIDLWRLFRREAFDVVHSITPKAGVLAMLAGRVARVPVRVHTFTGQVWATQTGLRRLLLKTIDRTVVWNATHALADSPSQRTFHIAEGIAKPSAIGVLGDGSVAGVDVLRFQINLDQRRRIRNDWGIPEDGLLFLFLGRQTRDKGLIDLARAFGILAEKNTHAHLGIVGPDEEGLSREFEGLAKRFPGRVHEVGFTQRPEDYMSAADVFCLPSYREGFGTTIIEAAAIGVPAIASRIYGVTDAVEDGVTGLLHPPGAPSELANCMLHLAMNSKVRRQMGDAARKRALERFPEERITSAFAALYRDLLSIPGSVK